MSKSSDSSEEEKDAPSKETKPNFGALTNLQPRAQRGVILPGLQPSPTKQNDEDKPSDGSKANVNNPFAGLLGIQPRGSRGGILPGLQPSLEKPKDENPSEEKQENPPLPNFANIQPRGSRKGMIPGLQPSPEKPQDEKVSDEKSENPPLPNFANIQPRAKRDGVLPPADVGKGDSEIKESTNLSAPNPFVNTGNRRQSIITNLVSQPEEKKVSSPPKLFTKTQRSSLTPGFTLERENSIDTPGFPNTNPRFKGDLFPVADTDRSVSEDKPILGGGSIELSNLRATTDSPRKGSGERGSIRPDQETAARQRLASNASSGNSRSKTDLQITQRQSKSSASGKNFELMDLSKDTVPIPEEDPIFIEDKDKKPVAQVANQDVLLAKMRRFLMHSDKSATFKFFSLFIFILFGFMGPTVISNFYYKENQIDLGQLAGALTYMSNSLSSPAISNIEVSHNVGGCPNGTQKILLGNFSGTVRGCECPSGVVQGRCSDTSDCVQYEAINSEPLYNWRSFTFCMMPLTYNVTTQTECESRAQNYCFPGGCFESQRCPITGIAPSSINGTGWAPNVTAIQVRAPTAAWFNIFSNYGKNPVVSLNTELYGMPCFSQNQLPQSSAYYPLVPQFPHGCGRYGNDPNAQILDYTTVYNFYNGNGDVRNTEINNLENYEILNQESRVYLVVKTRIPFVATDKCVKINWSQLSSVGSILQEYYEVLNYWVDIGLWLHILLTFGSILMYCYMRTGLRFRRAIFQKRKFQFFYLFFGTLETANALVLALRLALYSSNFDGNAETLQQEEANTCFTDWQAELAIQDLIYVVNNNIPNLNRLMFLFMFLAKGILIVFLFLGLLGKKTKETAASFSHNEE